MNIRKIFGYGLLAVMFALAALSLTGCGDVSVELPPGPDTPTPNPQGEPANNPSPSVITYTAVQDGGADGTANSTGIKFTFSASVDELGLAAGDIAVGGKASKGAGTLTGSGTTWTLPITVNGAGLATVKITKTGIEAATKDVTVYKEGEAAPEYWTITWHLNGGEKGEGAYPTQIEKGTALYYPSDPAKADNNFGGWFTDSDLTWGHNFSNPVTEDLNLYAKWNPLSQTDWTITWELNGGTGGDAYPTQIEKGAVLAQPSPDPTKDGYIFGGWYWDYDLIGPYSFDDPMYTVDYDLTLYAQWIDPNIGTPGLAYTAIGTTAYSVSKGSVIGGVVIISATHEGLPVTTIGSGAFNGVGLTSVTIPDSVTTISNLAFNGCSRLTSVTIPDSVTTIGDNAFAYCSGLTSVTIPAGVTSIGNYAFMDCTGLTSVTIGAGVTTISNNAFLNCDNLKTIIIDTDKVTNNQTTNWVTRFPADGLSITFKKNIGDFACFFSAANATKLTSVTIAEGVTSIGLSAFYNCSGLTSVTFAGTIASASFGNNSFPGDLRDKYLADPGGGPGTYTRPSGSTNTWTKSVD